MPDISAINTASGIVKADWNADVEGIANSNDPSEREKNGMPMAGTILPHLRMPFPVSMRLPVSACE
jgi:hypothetical protein